MPSLSLVSLLHQSMVHEVGYVPEQFGAGCQLAPSLSLLGQYFERLRQDNTYQNWSAWWQEYENLTRLKANLRNSEENFAACFTSWTDFLVSKQHQKRGLEMRTYWDTYEHGSRRKLESVLAGVFGSEDAVLVNSGMAALVCVLESLILVAGDSVLFDTFSYFESRHYLSEYLQKRGIILLETDLSDTEAVDFHLSHDQPRCVLCETSTIGPRSRAISVTPDTICNHPDSLFLMDNSIGSHNIRWFDVLPEAVTNLVVIESGSKTLSEVLMNGVIYGRKPTIDRVRDYAQSSGMQLQALAFNAFNQGDIRFAAERVKLHSTNVSRFVQNTQSRLPNHATVEYSPRPLAFCESTQSPVGPLVFISWPYNTQALTKRLDTLLATWQDALKPFGIPMPFRCGYGWHSSTARIYAGENLNRNDAPCYLRLSIGLEPAEIIDRLAETFTQALAHVF